jgi:hypothetical protein
MRCQTCRTMNRPEASYCQTCGAPLPVAVSPPAPTPVAQPPPEPSAAIGYAAAGARLARPYRAGSVLASVVAGLLCTLIVFDVVNIPIGVALIMHYGAHGYDVDDLAAAEIVQACTGVVQMLVYVTTAILFLVWVYRASSNLAPLGAPSQTISPGWAVGWWFIPFLNLVRPYQAVREIWQLSEPPPDALATAPSAARRGAAWLGWWWAGWLVSNIGGGILARVSIAVESTDGMIALTYASIAADVVTIVAAILAICVVRAIDARQTARHAALYGRQLAM